MNIEVTSADYRNGNPGEPAVKVNGVYKVGDVTFKRGLMGASTCTNGSTRCATAPTGAARRHGQPAGRGARGTGHDLEATNARPMRYTAPSLNAKTGTDVAIEELVLSIEDIVIE